VENAFHGIRPSHFNLPVEIRQLFRPCNAPRILVVLFVPGSGLTAASLIGDWLNGLVVLVLLLPGLAVGTRRLHDIGKTGWWQLIMLTGIGYFLLMYWWAQPTAQDRVEYDAASA
jgi:hypothetical protein